MRFDLYGLVHKAQRYHLFGFAQTLSQADLAEPEVRAQLAAGVRDIVEMLRDHAANEERYIHPLFAKLGTGSELLEHEHQALETRLTELAAIVEQGHWDQLYRSVMRLLGEYLLHIDAEERAQAEILWESYSDAELADVFMRFKAERAAAAAQADLMLMLPGLNVSELVSLLQNMRASVAAPSFQGIVQVAQRVLGQHRWSEVQVQLSAQ